MRISEKDKKDFKCYNQHELLSEDNETDEEEGSYDATRNRVMSE